MESERISVNCQVSGNVLLYVIIGSYFFVLYLRKNCRTAWNKRVFLSPANMSLENPTASELSQIKCSRGYDAEASKAQTSQYDHLGNSPECIYMII